MDRSSEAETGRFQRTCGVRVKRALKTSDAAAGAGGGSISQYRARNRLRLAHRETDATVMCMRGEYGPN